jgi:formamidopyrimidine-DNA glycosylase
MPELPEVETIRRALDATLRGRRILRVEQRRKDLRFPLPERFVERLTGRRIERLERRAKYILIHLDAGEVLAVHLGMTGRLSLRQGAKTGTRCAKSRDAHGGDAKHDHLVFFMSGGVVVTYNDARRFGYMTLIATADLARNAYLRGLGVEPLGGELSPAYLARRAFGKKVGLKALLMDQRIIAGLGNIYVCEALFRAGLDPFKPASRLASRSGAPTLLAERLVAAIKAVLNHALRAGGSTLRDYQQVDGTIGTFQEQFQIYGREGEPCAKPSCRGTVRRKTHGGRSTFYCPVCQR